MKGNSNACAPKDHLNSLEPMLRKIHMQELDEARVELVSRTAVGQSADFQPRPEMLVVLPCSHVMQVAKNTFVYMCRWTCMYACTPQACLALLQGEECAAVHLKVKFHAWVVREERDFRWPRKDVKIVKTIFLGTVRGSGSSSSSARAGIQRLE